MFEKCRFFGRALLCSNLRLYFYLVTCIIVSKIAEQGSAYEAVAAQLHLGRMYKTGLGVDQHYSTAVEWYRKAAERGYVDAAADAQFHLGLMYEKKLGVDQNELTAMEWYRKAAEEGIVEAQFDLDRLIKSLRKRKNSEM